MGCRLVSVVERLHRADDIVSSNSVIYCILLMNGIPKRCIHLTLLLHPQICRKSYKTSVPSEVSSICIDNLPSWFTNFVVKHRSDEAIHQSLPSCPSFDMLLEPDAAHRPAE